MTRELSYYVADLHLHTVLSPCAELEMLPPLIVGRAVQLGVGVLAVTDHNSAENAAAMSEAAEREGIIVLPGMEVQTREEVHLICLFDTLAQAQDWQERVYQHLPPLENRDEVFGTQLVVDVEGEFVACQRRLLLTSTSYSTEEVFHEVGDLGGIVIPAHVDRPAFSLIANLGMIPSELDVPAMEISSHIGIEMARQRFPQLSGITLIQSGDAHRLDEMQNRTMLKVKDPTVHEIALAFRGEGERKVLVDQAVVTRR